MKFNWTKDGKFSRWTIIPVEFGSRTFAADAMTHGKKSWISGWKLRELESVEGYCIGLVGSEYLVSELDAAIEEHLHKFPYTLEQAVDFASENEALELKGEEKLDAIQHACNNSMVYADQYGFTEVAFKSECRARGAR